MKRQFRSGSSAVRGIFSSNGEVIKDPQEMANLAADYYEKLFDAPVAVRPHPYIDSPPSRWENDEDSIPYVTYPEVVAVYELGKKTTQGYSWTIILSVGQDP